MVPVSNSRRDLANSCNLRWTLTLNDAALARKEKLNLASNLVPNLSYKDELNKQVLYISLFLCKYIIDVFVSDSITAAATTYGLN